MKINHKGDYAEQRRKLYPPIEDQLDALWKGGQDAADMKAKIDKIKSDHPKKEKEKDK